MGHMLGGPLLTLGRCAKSWRKGAVIVWVVLAVVGPPTTVSAAYIQLRDAPAIVVCDDGVHTGGFGNLRWFRARLVNNTSNNHTLVVGYIHDNNFHPQASDAVAPGAWGNEISGAFSTTNGDAGYVFAPGAFLTIYSNAQVAAWPDCS